MTVPAGRNRAGLDSGSQLWYTGYMKSFSIALLAALLLVFPGTAARADHLEVVTLEAPPLVYTLGDSVHGALVDVVREGLNRMGYHFEIRVVPWKRAVNSVRTGEADAIFYAVKTAERERFLRYPQEPLWVERTVAVVLSGTDHVLKSDLSNASDIRLGVGRGYYYGPRLERILTGDVFKRIEPAAKAADNMAKLLGGRLDAFLTDYLHATRILRDFVLGERFDIVRNEDHSPAFLDTVPAYLAFSKQAVTEELADGFSHVLKRMKTDGTYDAIMRRHGIEGF